jgi:hypothetical protein
MHGSDARSCRESAASGGPAAPRTTPSATRRGNAPGCHGDSNCDRDQGRVVNGRRIGEVHPVPKPLGGSTSDFERQTRLANSAGPNERDQPRTVQPMLQLGEVEFASDQTRQPARVVSTRLTPRTRVPGPAVAPRVDALARPVPGTRQPKARAPCYPLNRSAPWRETRPFAWITERPGRSVRARASPLRVVDSARGC